MLAEAIDLERQAKQAHWNVKGPGFYGQHKLFDELHELAEEWIDLVAERIAQLGHLTEGTLQRAAELTRLPEFPLGLTSERDNVEQLAKALAAFTAHTREVLKKSEELGDPITADILTEVTRGAEKYLWFVEAHLG
ncbi:MAG: DNA starvation/stationary phase protection protein Dps [Brockia lithotrophica]|nr:DNA starvation/stationary phase protection protein Dps [Brockia lithotrophica]